MARVMTWFSPLLLLLLLTHLVAPSPQRPVLRPAGNLRPGPELALAPSVSPCKEECTKIYIPVCASDGKSYNNLCILEVENCRRRQANRSAEPIVVVREGLCDTTSSASPSQCSRRCPESYEPVCGSNRQTYHNKCELSVANCLDDGIRQRYIGVCAVSSGSSSGSRSAGLRPSLDQSTAATGPQASVVASCEKSCTGGFRPVCGNNGVTYGSNCLFENARCTNPTIEKRADGVCPKDCSLVCPSYVEYVCGNNNVSYQNDCFLIIDQCKDSSIRKISEGRCTSTSVTRDVCNQKCTITYDPVCGSDGATYTNACTLTAATCHHRGLVKLYDSECKR